MEAYKSFWKAKEKKIGLDLGELAVWLVHVYARDRAISMAGAHGFVDSRHGQLRIGLWASLCYAYNGLYHNRATTCLQCGVWDLAD